MSEVRVTNEKTGGEKGSKPQAMALLPWEALLRVSEVYGFGAEKYAPNNWRKGYDWSLSFSALQRHLAAFWTGEDNDPESGLSHLAHAGFHILTLLVFTGEDRYAELDDRAKSELPEPDVAPFIEAIEAECRQLQKDAYHLAIEETVLAHRSGELTFIQAMDQLQAAYAWYCEVI